ncbi:cytochrome c oxidase subunit 7B, mitochondrial-like [Loxodonta africana]|uniref:cytochrome c oxidase subunit 7B, mitochondrial-like n=1 Tax=Loxodonta africana TaxID=9785 RepID=UPI0002233C72
MIFPMAKNALSHLRVRSIQQTMARQTHQKYAPDFHDNMVMLVELLTVYVAVWTHTATQTGTEWNLSPVGRVTPKEWRDQ